MPKITFIGAGSLEFTLKLCSDILFAPSLQDSTLTLMDINPTRLDHARQLIEMLVTQRQAKARIEATLDPRAAVRDADYVVTTFLQGGLDAFAYDIQIPQRYGVEQCVGDTLGPGGVFRALRTIPVLLELCRNLDDVAPDALLLNYVNPMAANCWGVDAGSGRPHVGLCHSVQGTSRMLARWIGVPYNELNFLCAGINHQAFFLEFCRGGEDLYPLLREAVERQEVYEQEPVRVELFKHFGYFVTESSGHASEYVPYFRKNARMVNEDLVPRFKNPNDYWFDFGRTGGVLHWYLTRGEEPEYDIEKLLSGVVPLPSERTSEFGSYIIEAMETDQPVRINGNVSNHEWITNLPRGCCVEVPCDVDARGIHPIAVGALPTQLAALNRTNVNVQELIVEAAVRGKRDAVYHAVMLDPLTAAACTLPQIHALVDELFEAEAHWLPQFQG
jgi:alpha-galactosidase